MVPFCCQAFFVVEFVNLLDEQVEILPRMRCRSPTGDYRLCLILISAPSNERYNRMLRCSFGELEYYFEDLLEFGVRLLRLLLVDK